jgi:hypothetical protein
MKLSAKGPLLAWSWIYLNIREVVKIDLKLRYIQGAECQVLTGASSSPFFHKSAFNMP